MCLPFLFYLLTVLLVRGLCEILIVQKKIKDKTDWEWGKITNYYLCPLVVWRLLYFIFQAKRIMKDWFNHIPLKVRGVETIAFSSRLSLCSRILLFISLCSWANGWAAVGSFQLVPRIQNHFQQLHPSLLPASGIISTSLAMSRLLPLFITLCCTRVVPNTLIMFLLVSPNMK